MVLVIELLFLGQVREIVLILLLRVAIEISLVILELLTQFLRTFSCIDEHTLSFISSFYVIIRLIWPFSFSIFICRNLVAISKAIHLHLQGHLS